MLSGAMDWNEQILNDHLEFEGTKRELSIAEIIDVEGYVTLDEEVVNQKLSYKPDSNIETFEGEHEGPEEFYEELAIPKKVDQIETTQEHNSNLGQIEGVHNDLEESYEELEIPKKVDRVEKNI